MSSREQRSLHYLCFIPGSFCRKFSPIQNGDNFRRTHRMVIGSNAGDWRQRAFTVWWEHTGLSQLEPSLTRGPTSRFLRLKARSKRISHIKFHDVLYLAHKTSALQAPSPSHLQLGGLMKHRLSFWSLSISPCWWHSSSNVHIFPPLHHDTRRTSVT